MKSNSEVIDALDKIGSTYGCKLCLPPFNNTNHPFFKIDELSKDPLFFREFFIELDSLDIDFRFAEVNGKKDYIEIIIGD